MVDQKHVQEPTPQLARFMGALAGFADRRRHMFSDLNQRGDLLIDLAPFLHGLTSALAAAVPEFRGQELADLLERRGTVALLLRLSAIPIPVLGRQFSTWLIANSLVTAIRTKGGEVVPPTELRRGDVLRFLDVALSPANRRAARRALERYAEELGLGPLTVDFAACWRADRQPIRHGRTSPPSRRLHDLAPKERSILGLLVVLIFACDCWTLRANPFDVLYGALVKLGYERWEGGADSFRLAITEGLVAATFDAIPEEHLLSPDKIDWPALLASPQALDWAGAVLPAFIDISRGKGFQGFRLLGFVRQLTNRTKRGIKEEPTDDHLRRLGHRVVSLDEAPERAASSAADPGCRVPEVHELRDKLGGQLSRRERQVLARRAHDLPFDQIGRELGMAPATARVLMLRARRAMAQASPSAVRRTRKGR
ncbi:MAG: hypothetical protein M3072_15760 [Candidatus Dormibacteraeota bacterium]|nr:hypothetical protein [Candidatus Dormibacteraeota bacterium]